MVVLRDIRFESYCEHHMAPIIGKAHVGYIPTDRVVGISKLARLVNVFGKRLQVQEKMTAQIANVLMEVLRITPEQMAHGNQIATMAAFLTGSSNNAAHPANGLAALFMATGQDMANIGEANQCTVYTYVTREGDLHYSITMPALIMATFGGGTSLSTQRECLEIMGCYGKDKAYKLIVEEQSYLYGRDATLKPAENVYRHINPDEVTPLKPEKRIDAYDIRLDWSAAGAKCAGRDGATRTGGAGRWSRPGPGRWR